MLVLHNLDFIDLYIAFVLQVNSFRLLLDCGWDDAYDTALLESLVPLLPSLDGVLISHPDPAHLGALPYLARGPILNVRAGVKRRRI